MIGLFVDISKVVIYYWPSDLALFFNVFIDLRETDRKRERNIYERQSIVQLPPAYRLLWIMCPDWELNRRPPGARGDTQPTEPHEPGEI